MENQETEVSKRGRRFASEAKRSESRETFDRSRRVPMGTPDMKLEVHNKDSSRVYRWMNDQGNRLHKAERAGYEFVESDGQYIGTGSEDRNSDVGSRVSQVVGTHENGEPMRAYLMSIPREFYEEDQRAKHRPIDEMERQIMSGAVHGNQLGQEDTYIPKEGIKRRVSIGRE